MLDIGSEYVIEQLICSLHSIVQVQLFVSSIVSEALIRLYFFFTLVSFKTGGITGYISICDAEFVYIYICTVYTVYQCMQTMFVSVVV